MPGLAKATAVRYNGPIMFQMELENLTMGYGRQLLFQSLFASAHSGEVLVVTGSNGAGKSTLLRVIAGLTRPEEGTVRFFEDKEERFPRETCVLGYAAPDVNLYRELTGEENLAFFAKLRGVSSDGQEFLERVGLRRAQGRQRVGTYSSGMRQRLKLAVSLIGNPQALIWDEPTATLDAGGGIIVEEILNDHRQSGGIAVVATNDLGEAERWGQSRIVIGS